MGERIKIQTNDELLESLMEMHAAGTPEKPRPNPIRRPTQVTIDAGDRQVQVLARLDYPRVVLLGGVLSHEECDELIALSRPKLLKSQVVDPDSGGNMDHESRKSEGTYFLIRENPLVERIDERIGRMLDWPVENGEGLQILHYRPGGEYTPHFDWFDPALPGALNGGNRVATLIIYLEPCEEGGATRFPDIGFEVMPQKGSALFFSYDRPSRDTLTLHAGLPVVTGEKWIATRWMREEAYVQK